LTKKQNTSFLYFTVWKVWPTSGQPKCANGRGPHFRHTNVRCRERKSLFATK